MLIAALQKSWHASVVPADAPPIQHTEMERSFYSGFRACLQWQKHHLGHLPPPMIVAQIDAAHAEAEQYFKTMAAAGHEKVKA